MVGVAALLIGVRSGMSTHQPLAQGVSTRRVATPVLSARRIPELIARGTAQRRLEASLGPRAATINGDFCFTAAVGGVSIIDHAGGTALMPASNLKLVTAFAALKVLGADSVLHTEVAAGAKPSGDGTVEGDLWFIGGGDPLIATANYVATNKYGPYPYTSLDTIADKVVASGVRRVTGAVRGDDHRYDDVRTVASWPSRYLSENQVGPLSALSVNDARTYPVGAATAGRPRPSDDPPRYAAAALTDLLRARGVTIDGEAATGQAPTKRTTLVDMPSLPIRDLVAQMLTFSDNNSAELLLKELGLRRREQPSTHAGAEVVADVLRSSQLDVDGFVQTDGSGLDRGDRVSCRTLQDILVASGHDSDLAAGLPVAGTSGTLRDRMRGPDLRGHVAAKTGSLRDVAALSGWVDGRGGTKVAFSFVLNTKGRTVSAADLKTEEQLVSALRNYPDAPDPETLGPLPAGPS